MELKIDIVYTYVDNSDIKWINKKKEYNKNCDILLNPTIRYENINEIYYNIKLVLKYMEWINNIYIITDDQKPKLDEELYNNKKIIIIDHKEIIDNKYLPTYNSDVIESYIHNIPNISEHIIYFNDDTFIMDYVKREDIYNYVEKDVKYNIINKFNYEIIKKKNSEYSKRIIYTYKLIGYNDCVLNH
jgi:hypothetical protein